MITPKQKTVIALGVLILILLGGYWYSRQQKESPDVSKIILNNNDSTQSTENWQYVRNDQAKFGLRAPAEAIPSVNAQGVSISYTGPTQSQGTEIYDGYGITIIQQQYPEGNDSLRKFVDMQLAGEQHASLTTPVTPIEINGVSGFTYSQEGLGSFKVVVLPQGTNAALTISYLVADPQNIGYQNTVDQILATLEMDK